MNLTIKILQDEYPFNPRTEFDHADKMVCFHKRYDLGDKHTYNESDFSSWQELIDHICQQEDVIVYLPLYLYDHSGISISTNRSYPFNCPWDSGQIGWIYITRKQVKEYWGWNKITEKRKGKLLDCLMSSVKEYDQFLTGDVWGYRIVDTHCCNQCGTEHEEIVDSCCGFYGEAACEEAAKESLAYLEKQAKEAKQAENKSA